MLERAQPSIFRPRPFREEKDRCASKQHPLGLRHEPLGAPLVAPLYGQKACQVECPTEHGHLKEAQLGDRHKGVVDVEHEHRVGHGGMVGGEDVGLFRVKPFEPRDLHCPARHNVDVGASMPTDHVEDGTTVCIERGRHDPDGQHCDEKEEHRDAEVDPVGNRAEQDFQL